MFPVRRAVLSMQGKMCLPQVIRKLPRSNAVALPPRHTILKSSLIVSLRTNEVPSNLETFSSGLMSMLLSSFNISSTACLPHDQKCFSNGTATPPLFIEEVSRSDGGVFLCACLCFRLLLTPSEAEPKEKRDAHFCHEVE